MKVTVPETGVTALSVEWQCRMVNYFRGKRTKISRNMGTQVVNIRADEGLGGGVNFIVRVYCVICVRRNAYLIPPQPSRLRT